MSSSAGVAPLPPGFHKLLSVTFTTFADDDCMLSVPSGTCELHISCWQGSDSCQAIAAAVLTLFNYALWFLLKAGDPFFVLSCCLANVLPAPRFPSPPPDTASFRSCLLLPPGFLDTLEAGICARSRALSSWWPQAACQ